MYAAVSVDLRCAVNVSEFAKRDGPSQSEFALPKTFLSAEVFNGTSEDSELSAEEPENGQILVCWGARPVWEWDTTAFHRICVWLLAILLLTMETSDAGSLSAGLESRVILHLDADCFYAQVHHHGQTPALNQSKPHRGTDRNIPWLLPMQDASTSSKFSLSRLPPPPFIP